MPSDTKSGRCFGKNNLYEMRFVPSYCGSFARSRKTVGQMPATLTRIEAFGDH